MKIFKKLSAVLVISVIFSAMLSSCDTPETVNTPQEVLYTYINGIAENDGDAVNGCYYIAKPNNEKISETDAEILKVIFSNADYTVVSAKENSFAAKVKIKAEKPDYKSALYAMYLKNADDVMSGRVKENQGENYYFETLNKCMADKGAVKIKKDITVNFMRVGEKWYLTGNNKPLFAFLFENISNKEPVNSPEDAVNEFLAAFTEYDLKAVNGCYYGFSDEYEASSDSSDANSKILKSLYTSLEYEVKNVKTDGITAKVTVNGDMLDLNAIKISVEEELSKRVKDGEIDLGKMTQEEINEIYYEIMAQQAEKPDAVRRSGGFNVYCVLMDKKWYITGYNKDMVDFVMNSGR